jgi:hypothetical protein
MILYPVFLDIVTIIIIYSPLFILNVRMSICPCLYIIYMVFLGCNCISHQTGSQVSIMILNKFLDI